jgi:hypothetical protein
MVTGPQIVPVDFPLLPKHTAFSTLLPGARSAGKRIVGWTAVVATLLLLVPSRAAADPIRIFESGTPGPDGQTSGFSIGEAGFTGLRFFLPFAVTTDRIGGHFGGLGGVDIFGAIVALSGPSDFPDSFDLSTPDVRGAARIVLSPSGDPVPSRVVSAPLEVGLTPGWHAVLFGAGLFGTSGTGLFTLDNFPNTGQAIFGSGGLTRPLPFQDGGLTRNRLYAFVDADAAPVPEPSTLLLLGSGLALLARRRRRNSLGHGLSQDQVSDNHC